MTVDLVEKELDWVVSSPVFYATSVEKEAAIELASDYRVSLPGPIVAAHQLEPLDSQFSANLLSNSDYRTTCLDELRRTIPNMASGRLGLRFEQYLFSILRARYGQENVLSRVPVREKTANGEVKTWGEFDFLFLDQQRQRIEHWESSVKFYLQVRDDSRWSSCWGPGVVDRLDLKGPKTFLQQLVLSSTASGHKAIPLSWQSYPLVKRVFAKGTIFYRWKPEEQSFESRQKEVILPNGLSREHLKSWWILPEDVSALRKHYPELRVVVLPRLYWMTGIDCSRAADSAFESWERFESHLSELCHWASERRECLMLGLYATGQIQSLITMGFIVTDHFRSALRHYENEVEHD